MTAEIELENGLNRPELQTDLKGLHLIYTY
jgi:hypothetical protein